MRNNAIAEEKKMTFLKISLVVFGLFYIFGVHLLMYWLQNPAWVWTPPHYEYEEMIQGVYATLGIFMILAARDPHQHLSLIWFTIWSNIVHGGIMFVQALVDATDHSNLMGDVPALFLVAIVLWVLMPSKNNQTL